uniref:NSFL1 cofactor p47 n=2 Tax=Laurasiatheria TaxID=314145 RepID=F7E2S8_HORSE
MAAERQEALREFVAVTGAEEDRARFFLESAGWDLQIALASFYEDGGDEDIVTISQATPSSVSRGTAPSDNRVTSFRDLIHDQDEEEEEEEGQRFYAGGSERSGQQIVGPPRKKSPNELVDDLFKGAKEHGAVAVERVTKSPGETSKPRPFAGGGYRLGAAPEEESAYVAGERRRHSSQDVHVVLKLWKSGFSLDNGELRSYQDPSNAQFLESIRRGEVPAELRRLAHGGQVNLDMEDHRDEDFVKPKGAFKAFTGEGQKLGSTAPQVLNTSSPAQQAENEAKASSSISIDEAQPTTNIQIRLADGGRLVQKFNHSHSLSASCDVQKRHNIFCLCGIHGLKRRQTLIKSSHNCLVTNLLISTMEARSGHRDQEFGEGCPEEAAFEDQRHPTLHRGCPASHGCHQLCPHDHLPKQRAG